MDHKITARNVEFKGHAFNAEVLNVTLPDGTERKYDLVRHANSVTIIPVDKDGNIYFVRQYRMGSEKILLELPAGVMDKNESPAACAAREVREEIGMAAGKLSKIGAIYLAPGYSDEINYIFLAEDLAEDPLQQDDDEFISIHTYSQGEVKQFIRNGELIDSKSIAALYILEQNRSK